MFKKIFIVSMLLFLSIGMVSASDNQTDVSEINVDGTNFGDIQGAIDDVEENGIINLDDKTYSPTKTEIKDYSSVQINKSVNIVGVYNKTVITTNKNMKAFEIEDANNVKIENIIFSKASPAVMILNSNVTFINCQFKGNDNSMGGALSINQGNVNIINCTFKDNVAKGREASVGGAIALINANGYVTNITNSEFINNAAMRGGAIYVVGDNSKTGYLNINNSRFKFNKLIKYDIDEEYSAGDISFYNPYNSKQINFEMSIDNSSFISVDDSELVDSMHPAVFLQNTKNIITNTNFTNYVMVVWNTVEMNIDKCNIENLVMYCYDKKYALTSGLNQLIINNSDIKNGYLDSGLGSVENTDFNSNSRLYVYANSFKIVNSTFNQNSAISLGKGNLSVIGSSFSNSAIEMDHFSEGYAKSYLNFIDSEFKNNVKIDANSRKTTFDNCTGLENLISPANIEFNAVTTYYKSGKSFTVKVIDRNENKALKNFKFTLKLYKGRKLVKTFNLKTDNKGKASIKVSGLAPSTYAVKTTFSDKSYYFSDYSNFITVTKIPTTVKAPKVVNKFKKSKYFKITVKHKKTKKTIKGLKLKIKVYTGKKYKIYKLKTNKKGVAKLNTKKLKRGSHKVVITSGNSNYKVSAKSTIKIK